MSAMMPAVPSWREVLDPHLTSLHPRDKHWTPALAEAATRPVPLAELPTPALTLDLDALAHNLAAMGRWCGQRGVELAPHGKTTMAPGLWHWQLAAGCQGITVANVFQLRVAREARVPRVVVANELLAADGLAWLAGELSTSAPEDFDVLCWADSVAGVELMTTTLRQAGVARPLGVCVELGAPGSRTGVRDLAGAEEVAAAVRASPVLRLCGVAAYEGSVKAPAGERQGRIENFLAEVRRAFVDLAGHYETAEPVLSAGGSAWFDLVAGAFDGVAAEVPGARVVLRSGAYLVHDHLHYAAVTPAATRSGPELRPAARGHARVLSVPEPGLALLDAGKRDLPYDIDLPRVLEVRRAEEGLEVDPGALNVVGTNDQHAYVEDRSAVLAVGDVLRLGLSHPCTMFDKWRSVLLVEDEHVVGALPTFF